jgi:putative tricarboxylic transport membrane protein
MDTTRLITADRIGGLIWFVFGAAVVYGSWMMDRLESQNIPPVTAPGLVPGLLGAGIIAFALVLMLRSEPASVPAPVPSVDAATDVTAPAQREAFHWKRVVLSLVLCLTYGAVLLGSGVHYWILTAAFLFLHILLLDETERVPARPSLRRLVTAAVMAPAVATVVTLVFQHVFLVRLP